METNSNFVNPAHAAADLAAVAQAESAVRDRPWPTWLYVFNALGLGLLGPAMLIESAVPFSGVVAIVMCLVNYRVGVQLGAPFAVPSGPVFRGLLALCAVFLVVGLIVGLGFEIPAVIIGASVAAMLTYAVASVVHIRATRS